MADREAIQKGFLSGYAKNKKGKRTDRSASFFVWDRLQHVQHERQDDEHGADPFGRAGELGVHALGLVLCHEGIGDTADCAAQAGGLTALEEDDGNDEQTAEKLKNGDE